MKLNLPNKLTVARMVMVPFLMVFITFDFGLGVWSRLIAAAFFGLASFTDFVDGHIARRDGLVTNFGKFMDPLADKLLVCSALICLIELQKIPAYMVIIIIAREFIISGFRLIAAENGVVIAANYWGKFKTTFQMIMVCLMIANIEKISLLTNIVMWVALALTVISLIDYIWVNRGVMADTK